MINSANVSAGDGQPLPAGRRASAADSIPVQILDPNLKVTTVLSTGIVQPIGIVFLGANDFLVPRRLRSGQAGHGGVGPGYAGGSISR